MTRSCIRFAVPLLGLLMACQDETALSPSDTPSLVKTSINPNGPVWVLGTFTLTIQISAGDAGENKHPQGLGHCAQQDGTVSNDPADNIYWFAPGNPTQVTGAPFCQASQDPVSHTVTCTIDNAGLPATYAFGTGGQGIPSGNQTSNNENLNFHSDLIPQQLDQFVHYQAPTLKGKKGNTTGKDETAFTFTCDDGTVGDAYIALDGFNAPGTNLFGRGTQPAGSDRWLDVSSSGIAVNMYASGDGPYTQGDQVGTGTLTSLYWLYRSRVGS
jgi:hypothetical protein